MTQPPAVVAQTFKPAGQLQLHRLGERARFHCIRCQQDKTASLVATMGGNWTHTVCIICYGALVNAQKEKANTAATAKQRPVQARQQSSRKVEPEQPKGKQPEPIGKKERRQLEKDRRHLKRQLPGADRLLSFFRAAGVRVELRRGRRLWINGRQGPPLAQMLRSRETRHWNSVIDEMAATYVGDTFRRAVADNARFDEGLRPVARQSERGFAIMRDDLRLGVIRATHAFIRHRGVIHANFLKPGPHWQQVADVVHGAEPELMAEWKRKQEAKKAAEAAAAAAKAKKAKKAAEAAAAEAKLRHVAVRRRIDQLPHELALELTAACLDSSRRIRLERQVAYERPVVLESGFGELTLLPIAGTETPLRMPFRLNKGTKTLKGELVLGDRDPLPLLIGEGVTDEDAITAWTCALLGFADATCIELEPVKLTARRESARPRWRPLPAASQRRPSTRTLPRKRPWPRHLEPVGHWVRYSGSFVAGHRRHLHDGQTASAEARDRARLVGITLHPHETWVRPHARGVPEGIEMRFLWHAPAELKRSHT